MQRSSNFAIAQSEKNSENDGEKLEEPSAFGG